MIKALLTAAILCLGLVVVFGQQSEGTGIFTSAQAEAGRVATRKPAVDATLSH